MVRVMPQLLNPLLLANMVGMHIPLWPQGIFIDMELEEQEELKRESPLLSVDRLLQVRRRFSEGC